MIRIIVTGLFLFLSFGVFSQTLDCKLIGEGNGDIVRLKWVTYAWPQNLDGFFIKRRNVTNGNTSSWTSLHADLIYPELSTKKSYANVEPLAAEQKRLSDKLVQMLAAGNAREISRTNFYQEILSNPGQLQNLRVGFVVDYDLALLEGFGLIDRNMTAGQTYEYGLFAQYKDQPVAGQPLNTYTWKYGTRPDLSLKTEVKIKRAGRKGNVEVIWKVNTEEMTRKSIAGFFLYKKTGNGAYIKLNNTIQFVSLQNKMEELIYRDQITDDNILVSYAAAPVSVMGSEGEFIEVNYSINTLDVSLVSPILGYINTIGDEEKPFFEWTFNAADELYIKGFILERKLAAAKVYEKVSDVIAKDQRMYTDNSINKAGLYTYRLVTIKNDNTTAEGQETQVNYTFVPAPPAPVNLVGKYLPGADQDYIELNWMPPKTGDVIIGEYHVYMATPSDKELYDDATFPLVKGNSCQVKVGSYQRGQWKFALAAVGAGKESEQTQTITVFAPSKEIAAVNNTYLQITDSKAKITWVYYGESIPDLAGFRIYQNGELVANEAVLIATSNEWTSKALEKGKKYTFEIVALTTYGVVSEKRLIQADIK